MSVVVRSFACACVLGLALVSTSVQALSMKDAIEQVERETSGKVLSASSIRTRGTVIYRIKVLMPDGRVRIFQIPA